MIARRCIVCGHDITGRWPAQVCSMLCRSTAEREKWRRKHRRRSRAYKLRRQARKVESKRAKRQADPNWQAWRADVDARKLQAQQRLQQRQRAGRLRDLSVRLKQQARIIRNKLARDRKRERDRTEPYRLKAHEREMKRSRQMAPIHALRELGLLDGYEIVVRPDQHQYQFWIGRRGPDRKPRDLPKPLTKYRRFVWAYADRYQAFDLEEKGAVVDRLYMAFGRSRRIIANDLERRSRMSWPVCPNLIVVDSQGTAKIGGRLTWITYAPVRRQLERQRRLKCRTILAAFDELRLLPNLPSTTRETRSTF